MKKGKRQRLIPLTVMIAPEQLEWVKAQTYGTGDSMGRVVRQLIDHSKDRYIILEYPKTKGEKHEE